MDGAALETRQEAAVDAIENALRWLDRVCRCHSAASVHQTYSEARAVREQLRGALAQLRGRKVRA